ncbi:MAG: efflux RND transporter periplasmic adaptor subunit [Calditrichaeota bacterium]|nr:efflux RND transporter periplasmic adaptor subunit [Candidatus Cloacimonadota bacterium]MCA9787482.1 efflux RND transporter periplasmic adaptor subunit [Candidatus Cloacimonadota bacterium]MCB1046458.1 efflux RND transporter periplasmic adaptor subunit [Calditrichota bacterium]MCB9474882.1 efflux RND transporter periplasmic adaptor subunit [Candidatus Delongbacteria bacterium]
MYKRILVPGLLALGLLCAACGDRSADDVSGVETAHDHAAHDTDVAEGVGHDDHAGHDHAAHADAGISSDEGHDAHDDHAGHDHGAEEGSDLDRPLEELFAAECEHAIKTWQCDECRYEVGVVRAPEELFEQGLLKMATVESRAVELPTRLTGEIVFDEERVSHLASTVPGVIRKVHVSLGDRVSKGQILLELESAEAGEAREAWLEAEAELALATRDHERMQEMHSQKISSEKEYLRAQQTLESARIRVDTALSRLSWMGLNPEDSRTPDGSGQQGRVVLRAPADGTVLTMHAVPGETTHPEEALATVGDNRVLWVWCDLYERDISAFLGPDREKTKSARVSVKAWPGMEFPGTVDFVSPSMDPVTRTAKLRVAVDNPDGRLMAGMFASVKVGLPGSSSVATLPQVAICEDEGRAFVFVPHDKDHFVRRPVTTGRAWGDRVELLEVPTGLDAVVAEGAFLLKSDVLRSKMGAGCAD